jgi:hypothetical protein
MAQAGHAVYKCVIYDYYKPVLYTNSHKAMLLLFFRLIDKDIDIYFRNINGWNFVLEHRPPDKCQCGRAYNYSSSGEDFRRQQSNLVFGDSIANIIELMSSPILCQICYYKDEIRIGAWSPLWVRQQLGIAT